MKGNIFMKKINSCIEKILINPTQRLIFALLAGVGYFVIVMKFVISFTAHAGLMGLFIAPAVICGTALVIIKSIKKYIDAEETPNAAIFYINFAVIIMAIIFAFAQMAGV